MNRLLVITAWFPPSEAIGAQRPLNLIREIRHHGWEPVVLTLPPKCNHRKMDPSTLERVPGAVHIETVPCWSPWQHSRKWGHSVKGLRKLLAYLFRGFARLTEAWVPIDMLFPWSVAATRKGTAIVNKLDIDLIWATSPPVSTHWLARRIALRTDTPYITDFRDITISYHTKELRKLFKVVQLILRDTAGISYSAPGQIGMLRELFPFVDRIPQTLLYSGFDNIEIAECKPYKFDRPTIVYGGALYGGTRRISGFFKALANIDKQSSDLKSALQFLAFLVSQGDKKYLSRLLIQSNLEESVQLRDGLSRKDFLSVCRGANILLLVVGHGDNHSKAIPGKLFSYFAACRPILVIGPRGCDSGRMTEELNRGIAVPDDDPGQITDALKLLLNGEGRGGRLDLSIDTVQQYEVASVIEKAAYLFSDTLSTQS